MMGYIKLYYQEFSVRRSRVTKHAVEAQGSASSLSTLSEPKAVQLLLDSD